MKARKYLAAGLVALTLGAAANAAVITFSDRSAWQAATTATTTIDFEGVAPVGGFSDLGSTGYTQSGVTFTGSGNYLFVVDPAYSPANYDWGSGAVLLGNDDGTITANLAGTFTAVGVDMMSILPRQGTIRITLSTGDTADIATDPYPNRVFFGVTSDVAISSISFTGLGSYPELDNFSFGNVGTVPVPSSLALIALALAGLAAQRRHKSA